MLRLRDFSDCQPRSKNGQPAHSTTGVAKASCSQFDSVRSDQAMQAEQMPAHLQHHHRDRQREADGEPPRHVGKLGIGAGVGGRDLGLERHAADRAGAGAKLPDLGVHGARVDRARRSGLGRRPVGALQVFFRVGSEFRPAARRTERVGLIPMPVPVRGLGRIHRHATDGIQGLLSDRHGVLVVGAGVHQSLFGVGCKMRKPRRTGRRGRALHSEPDGVGRQVDRCRRPTNSTAETARPTIRPLENSGNARISFCMAAEIAIRALTPPCR